MAIDGTGIIDSDLAHDIQNEFLQHYDAGLPINEIRQKLRGWLTELSDDLEREIFTSVMCQVLWEVGELCPEDLQELTLKLQDESGLEIWKTVGADAYQKRKKTLQKQLEKISKPKLKVRKRISAPTPFFRVGDWIEYQTSSGEVFHLLLIETCQKGKTFLYALAPLKIDPESLNLESISDIEFIGHKVASGSFGAFLYGLSVALLNHRIIMSFQNRFKIKLNVTINFKKAKIGSFGGIISIDDFEKEIIRVLADHKAFRKEPFKLGLIIE